jgi:hypothetical protein
MIVVVTAAIGTTETPPPPPFVDTAAIRYVCASDRDRDVQGWEPWPVAAFEPRRGARAVKMQAPAMFHGDTVIWCDASFDWIASPEKLAEVSSGMNCDLAAFAHPDRQRMTQEANEVIRCGLAPYEDVRRQVLAYRLDGFDTDAHPQRALTTTGLIVFGTKVAEFMRVWREQIDTFTLRDQLSVDYAAWKTGVRIGYLAGHYRSNAFVSYNRDRHRRRRAA